MQKHRYCPLKRKQAPFFWWEHLAWGWTRWVPTCLIGPVSSPLQCKSARGNFQNKTVITISLYPVSTCYCSVFSVQLHVLTFSGCFFLYFLCYYWVGMYFWRLTSWAFILKSKSQHFWWHFSVCLTWRALVPGDAVPAVRAHNVRDGEVLLRKQD